MLFLWQFYALLPRFLFTSWLPLPLVLTNKFNRAILFDSSFFQTLDAGTRGMLHVGVRPVGDVLAATCHHKSHVEAARANCE